MGGGKKVSGAAAKKLLRELTDIKLPKNDKLSRIKIAGAGTKAKAPPEAKGPSPEDVRLHAQKFGPSTRRRQGLLGRSGISIKPIKSAVKQPTMVARKVPKPLPGGTKRTYRSTAVAAAGKSKEWVTINLPLRRPQSVRMRLRSLKMHGKVPGYAQLITKKTADGRTVRRYVSKLQIEKAVDLLVKAGRSSASAKRSVMRSIREAM